MPTLSVILCNYNHGAHIGKAIEAIVNQSRPPEEFIIIEDGSTDNSVAMIEPYVKKHSVIRFLQNPGNKGLMYSFARGVSEAGGDFIYGASADDYILPGFFEKVMAAAEKHPQSGAIMGGYRSDDERGKQCSLYELKHWKYQGYQPPSVFAEYFYAYPCTAPSPSAIYHREHFASVGGLRSELGPISDLFATHALLLRYGGVYIPEIFAVNVLRGTSFSRDMLRNPQRIYETVDKMVDLMRTPEFSDCFSRQHTDQFAIYAKLLFGPYDPEKTALVPRDMHHLRAALIHEATWNSPMVKLASLFMKGMLAVQTKAMRRKAWH